MQIESIIFDFDGVIIESVDIKGWAFGKLFERYPEYVDEITAIFFFIISGSSHDEMRAIIKAKRILKYFKGIDGSPTTKSVWIKSIIEEQKMDPEQIIFVVGIP